MNEMKKVGAESQRMRIFEPHKIVRAHICANGKLEIVRQYPSNMALGNGTPCPDRVVKEIYGVVDGRIVLTDTVEGNHIPARLEPERIEFDE